MPALIGPIGTVVNMNQAAYGNAMGNPSYASQLAVAQGVNGQSQIIALYNQALTNTTPAALTATVMNNLFITTAAGVSQANVTAISTYLNSVFAQFPTAKGQIISNLTNILGGLEGDAAWGGAATAFNNEAAADYAYSINPANINSGSATTVNTYTLTTGVDSITGTSGNDTVVGVTVNAGTGTTLNVFDTIAMGAGTDTLNLSMAGTAMAIAAANTPTLGGIEIINLNALTGATSLVGSLAPDATTLNLNYAAASAVTVTAASASLTTFGLGASTAVANDLTVTTTASGGSSATNTVTLNVTGVNSSTAGAANDALITFNGSSASTDQGIENFVINATGSNALESLISNEVAAGNSALSSLTINGTGSFVVDTALVFDATNIGTINASANSGGTDLGVGNITLTYNGGSGNDILRFSAGSFSSADTVNFGTGTADTLFLADTSIGAAADASLNAAINAITSLDVLGISGAATVDMSRITVNTLSLGSGNNVVLQNLAAADSVQVNAVTAGNINATAALGFNTVNLALNQSADGVAATGTLNVTGNSTINISSNSTGTATTANTIGAVTNSANAVFTLTGSQALSITSFSAVATAVNGSAMTGVLTATGGDAASSLVGGSGRDVLTGGTVAGGDSLVGGAGNDTLATAAITGTTVTSITGGTGADNISLAKTGADVGALVTLRATAAESYATASQFDTVTFANQATNGTNIVTLVTGILSSTVTGATSVVIGTTSVAANSFLAVGSVSATLTTTNQNFQIYQDSNGNGVIDATDLRVDFTDAAATDTMAVTIVGGQIVVTSTGV